MKMIDFTKTLTKDELNKLEDEKTNLEYQTDCVEQEKLLLD